jgi:hypothetical protein
MWKTEQSPKIFSTTPHDMYIIQCTIVHPGGFFLHPMRGGQWRKSTNDNKEAGKNSDAAVGRNFRISKCFHLSKQVLYFWFSHQKGMYRKYKFSFTDLQKQYLSGHPVPLK